jgi:hypothetical protein
MMAATLPGGLQQAEALAFFILSNVLKSGLTNPPMP